jgi:hypothetical protein
MPQRLDFRPEGPPPEKDTTATVTHGLDGETHVEFHRDDDPLLLEMIERRKAQSYGNASRPPIYGTAGPAPESRDTGLVGRATGMAAKSLDEINAIYHRPKAAEGASRGGGWHFPAPKPTQE